MEQVALLKVSEENEIVGYYLVDQSVLDSLGVFTEFPVLPKEGNCGHRTRPCVTPGYEHCCCYPIPNGEILVYCPS